MPWSKSSGEGASSRVEQSDGVWPSAIWSPAADVLLTDETVVVRVELAGVACGDVRVRSTSRELIVSGLRHEPAGARPRRIDRMEIGFGPFARSIPLPESVQPEEAEARLSDGLLEVVLPLAEPTEPPQGLVLSIVVVGHDA
jgi:HSP20 family protein